MRPIVQKPCKRAGRDSRRDPAADLARSSMYGVIADVRVDGNADEAGRIVRDVVMPRATLLPGFASGNWLQELEGDRGIAVMLFESEETARSAAERIRSQGPLAGALVELERVDAYQVVAQT